MNVWVNISVGVFLVAFLGADIAAGRHIAALIDFVFGVGNILIAVEKGF